MLSSRNRPIKRHRTGKSHSLPSEHRPRALPAGTDPESKPGNFGLGARLPQKSSRSALALRMPLAAPRGVLCVVVVWGYAGTGPVTE